MSQTTVADSQTAAPLPGDIQSAEPGSPRSYTSAEATAEIPFGVLCVLGTDEDAACVLATSNGIPAGIVVRSKAVAIGTEFGDVGYKPKATLGLLRKGTIAVQVEDAVDPGDAVRVRHTAGEGEQKGAFRSAVDGTDCSVLSGAMWIQGAGAGGIAILEVDLTAATLTADL